MLGLTGSLRIEAAEETDQVQFLFYHFHNCHPFFHPEVEFVHPVSPGGSVKFLASGVNFSIFTHFLCFFLLKLLKLGEIDGVKFLA